MRTRRSFLGQAPARVVLPEHETPLMRVLEPRVLLDAAALETALDVAAQAAHFDLAEAYVSEEAAARSPAERTPLAVHRSAAFDDMSEIVQQDMVGSARAEIVFIDAAVPDLAGLVASVDPAIEVHVLNADEAGLDQIAAALDGRGPFDAVHVMSHGSTGQLVLGSTTLDMAALDAGERRSLATLGAALDKDGDLLIYGCDFGRGASGESAVARLAALTGADVAASSDLTGAAALDGDWDLEQEAGEVETIAFSLPAFSRVLDAFELSVTEDPRLNHAFGGVIGTVGTQARFTDAVTYDPQDGGATVSYDLLATFVGSQGSTSVAFEALSTTDSTLDDVRVVVTNIGGVNYTTSGGEDVLQAGSVSVLYEIVYAGTRDVVPGAELSLVFDDLDGIAGELDARDGVSVNGSALTSYSVDASTTLATSLDMFDVDAFGTVAETDGPSARLKADWQSTSQVIVTYHSRQSTAAFDMDGDGDRTLVDPVETRMQAIDLDADDSSGATGGDYRTTYRAFGGTASMPSDPGVAIADADVVLTDRNDRLIAGADVALTNAFAGDVLDWNRDVADDLGIVVTPTGAAPGQIGLQLRGFALTEDFATLLATVTFRSTEPAPNATQRLVATSFFDGIGNVSLDANTRIDIAAGTSGPGEPPVVANDAYVFLEGAPSTIVPAANGLLANDRDPAATGDGPGAISITDAVAADGTPIVLGAATVLSNGSLTLDSDGSFAFEPVENGSGVETLTLTLSNGTASTTSQAILNVRGVADPVTLTPVLPANSTMEDGRSDPLSLTLTSGDPNETLSLQATAIPSRARLTDGVNVFEARFDDNVDITDWDLDNLSVVPFDNSDEDLVITFVAVSREENGSTSQSVLDVTFEIDAVADEPLVLIERASAAIDEDVELWRFIEIALADTDGSERITEVYFEGIPLGVKFLVNGVERDIVYAGATGSISLAEADIETLVLRPEQTGAAQAFDIDVYVRSSEVNAENGIALRDAWTGPVILPVDINATDDPVIAVDDMFSGVTGAPIALDVIANDDVPDGFPQVIEIDGQSIDALTPITLAGRGVVSIDDQDQLVFTPDTGFSGTAVFEYTLADVDFSLDTATVVVNVAPRWSVAASALVQEGDDAIVSFVLEGSPSAGSTASVNVALADLDAETDAGDRGSLSQAITDAIAADPDAGFSFSGSTLTYTAPAASYPDTYDADAGGFADASVLGQPLLLNTGGVVEASIGFEFELYGEAFTELFVSANGYVTFGSAAVAGDNTPLGGTALGGRPAIAAYWDDLEIPASGDVYTLLEGNPGAHRFTVQWNAVDPATQADVIFQLALDEATGSVTLHYGDVEHGNVATSSGASATIGMQGAGGNVDTHTSNLARVDNGSTLVFTRPDIVRPTLAVAIPIFDDPTFELEERFAVDLSDASSAALGEARAVITIAVSDNDPPVAEDDAARTDEDTPVSFNVITGAGTTGGAAGADSEPQGQAFSLTAVDGTSIAGGGAITLASGAQVTANSNGDLVYDPAGAYGFLTEGQTAAPTFTYEITDEFGGTATGTVTVTIDGVNTSARFDLDGGSPVTTDRTVAYRDNDPAVNVAAATAVVFDPDNATLDRFEIVLGGFLQGSDETVTIVGSDYPYGVAANSGVRVVNVNGTDHDIVHDGANTFEIIRTGGGTITHADADAIARSITYVNTAGFDIAGSRTFAFRADDGFGYGAASVATVNVLGTNTEPDAVDDGTPDRIAGMEDVPLEIAEADLLLNDSDVDGDAFAVVSVQNGVGGTVSRSGGTITFTPDRDRSGPASFEYTIEDARAGRSTATVFLDFAAVNDAPTLDLDSGSAGTGATAAYVEDAAATAIMPSVSIADVDSATISGATITLTNGFAGDTVDASGVPATIDVASVPNDLATGLAADGSATITLSGVASVADYEAALAALTFATASQRPDVTPRSFDVRITDGTAQSLARSAVVTVTATDDAPVPLPDDLTLSYPGTEDTDLSVPVNVLLANDTDPDEAVASLSLVSVSNPVGGTVAVAGPNIVFTPDPDYSGAATFDYTVRDDSMLTGTATVTLDFAPVNDAPTLDLDANVAGRDYTAAFVEDAGPVSVADPSVVVADIDDASLVRADILLANGQTGDRLVVSGTLPTGLSAQIVPDAPLTASGTVTVRITGTGSAADYALAIAAVAFDHVGDAPAETDRRIEITVGDDEDESLVARTTIVVTATNDAPLAAPDGPVAGTEDQQTVISIASLLANDTDPDGETPTLVSVQDATNGTVAIVGSNVVYTPDPDFSGTATFTTTIRDAAGATSTASTSVTVSSVNDAPELDLDPGSAGLDHAVTYTENGTPALLADPAVMLADVDTPDLVSVRIVLENGRTGDFLDTGTLPDGITASTVPSGALTADGRITLTLSGPASLSAFTLALSRVGFASVSERPDTAPRTVSFVAFDGADVSARATSTVTVVSVNDAPVAASDGPFSVDEDASLFISAAALTANDTDLDGDTLTLQAVGAPVGGTVSLSSGGATFVPDQDFFGTATFEYTIRDTAGETATAIATVEVASVNDAPVLDADATTTGFDHAVTYVENAPGVPVVSDDVTILDVDDAELAFVQVLLSNGRSGDVLEVAGLPGGIDASVVPSGALGASGSIVVSLTGPASAADFADALRGVTFRSLSDRPDTSERTITVVVNDGSAASNTVTTRIAVSAVNDVPDAGNDTGFATAEDTSLTITTSALLANDRDLDGDTLVVTAVAPLAGGSVSLSGDRIVFTPTPNANGLASFEYTVSDGQGGATTAVAEIDVSAVDDAPTIDLDPLSAGTGYTTSWIEDGAPVAVTSGSIDVSDIDSANLVSAEILLLNGAVGDRLDITVLPANITATAVPAGALAADGSIRLVLTGPASQAEFEAALAAVTYSSDSQTPRDGVRTLDIAVSDNTGQSNVAQSRIDVTSVNDVPVVVDDGPLVTDEDTALVITPLELLANDSDLDGDTLSVTAVSGAAGGTVAIDADGLIVFTPTPDYAGAAVFDYTVSDGTASVSGTVSIDILPVNDAPVVDPDPDASSPAGPAAFATTYVENGAPVRIVDFDVRITDVDGTEVHGATIVLTNAEPGDRLSVNGLPPGITAVPASTAPVTVSGPLTLTLTGVNLASIYEAALIGVTFESVTDDPVAGMRLIELSVTDGTTPSPVVATTVSVVAVNDAPIALDDLSFATDEDVALTFDPTANDDDLEGDTLEITAIDGLSIAPGGTVTIGAGLVALGTDGRTLTYTPAADLNGQVAFGYTVSDGNDVASAAVAIDVRSVNDVPVARDDGPVVLDEDTTVSVDPVTANDTDADDDALEIVALGGSPISAGGSLLIAEGSITLGLDSRTLTFAPREDWNGTVVIPYTVSDGLGGSDTAEVTFDVAPVNDPLKILGTPPAVTQNDGTALLIDMARFVADPDGDPIIYTATGLPEGVSIERDTGIVSGTLTSTASLLSPYTIVVTADDGAGSTEAVSFELTALNVAPVALDAPTVAVDDGAIVAVPAATLFESTDGDTLSYTATGLPVWASIDRATGMIEGVAPFDASVSGPVVITVTATDPSLATAETTVILEPGNVAPELVRALPRLLAQETRDVFLDLAPFFRDGGTDRDPLVWTVTGLPQGLVFDPATAIVSGQPAEGTLSTQPYSATITVSDGQGGSVTRILQVFVGDLDYHIEADLFDDVVITRPAASARPVDTAVAVAVNAIADLNGTADLGGANAVGTAVGQIASLSSIDEVVGATPEPVAQRIVDEMRVTASAGPIDYVVDANGDLVPVQAEPLLTDVPVVVETNEAESVREIASASTAPASTALTSIAPTSTALPSTAPARALDVAAQVRGRDVFVDVRPAVTSDAVRSGLARERAERAPAASPAPSDGRTIGDVVFALRDAAPEAQRTVSSDVAMRVIRSGFAAFTVPADLAVLSLTLAARTSDGLAVEDIDIDTESGLVTPVDPASAFADDLYAPATNRPQPPSGIGEDTSDPSGPKRSVRSAPGTAFGYASAI